MWAGGREPTDNDVIRVSGTVRDRRREQVGAGRAAVGGGLWAREWRGLRCSQHGRDESGQRSRRTMNSRPGRRRPALRLDEDHRVVGTVVPDVESTRGVSRSAFRARCSVGRAVKRTKSVILGRMVTIPVRSVDAGSNSTAACSGNKAVGSTDDDGRWSIVRRGAGTVGGNRPSVIRCHLMRNNDAIEKEKPFTFNLPLLPAHVTF